MTPYDDDLRLAHVIADQVDAHTMSRYKAQDLHVITKPDETPVTDADRTAEEVIRAHLTRARGRDAVIGEEFGDVGHGARKWIIDPIDGTKNFMRGVPVWATLIALADGDDIAVGLVSAPALGRRWWAAKGSGAWTGKSLAAASRLLVSEVDAWSQASFSYSSLNGWAQRGRLEAFVSTLLDAGRTRAFGDFWSYMLVAEGAVDAAAEPSLELYDMAALVPIVTEAGGRFTSLEGADGPWGRNALATNGRLHAQLLARLE